MPSKPKEKELIPADEKPVWSVASTEPDAQGRQIHRLFYGKKRQASSKSPADLIRFRQLADFCNKQRLEPRPKILCKADENLPIPRRKTAPVETPEPAAAP